MKQNMLRCLMFSPPFALLRSIQGVHCPAQAVLCLDSATKYESRKDCMNFARVKLAFVIVALIVAGRQSVFAACTNATVKGTYGILSTGLNGSLQPASSVDQILADGAGSLTGTATKSINGTIVTFSFTGTYNIATNCTGTAIFNNQDGTIEHGSIYLNNGNTGAFLIQTDSNHVQSSVGLAQGAASCTNLGVKHPYSFEATGTVIGTGQVAMGGRLTLNGTGAITGTATLSLNGAIHSAVQVTGTYNINSNCTGSAAITPKGLPTINLNLVVVNAGKEIMAVETDTNTIVAGTFLQ